MSDSKSIPSSESIPGPRSSKQKPSYWAQIVSRYEERNASLEQRQTELSERIRLMECAVPSLLMGAMVSMKRNLDPAATKFLRVNEQSGSSGKRDTNSNRWSSEQTNGQLRVNGKQEMNRFFKNTDFRP